jgi:hypothetical protein
MKISDSEDTKSLFTRYKPGRRFYVFVISLFLASGFWLLNALNKTYREEIEITLKYINLPEDRAFSPVPHRNIKIELSGDGYSLIQFRDVAEEDTVVIDVSTLNFVSIEKKKRASIPTSLIINDLKSEFSNNMNVTHISRDTIEIITERGISKELKVKPNYSVTLAKGMVLKKPIYVSPEWVNTHGPMSVLEEMIELTTVHIYLDEISEYQEIETQLSYNSKLLNPEFRSVKIIAEVEALTEGEIEIPIHVVDIPKGKRVRLLPQIITLKYSTGLSHYDLITPELFEVVVRYEDVLKNPSKLPVTIRTYPSYVNIIQYIPERVDYLIMDLEDKL